MVDLFSSISTSGNSLRSQARAWFQCDVYTNQFHQQHQEPSPLRARGVSIEAHTIKLLMPEKTSSASRYYLLTSLAEAEKARCWTAPVNALRAANMMSD